MSPFGRRLPLWGHRRPRGGAQPRWRCGSRRRRPRRPPQRRPHRLGLLHLSRRPPQPTRPRPQSQRPRAKRPGRRLRRLRVQLRVGLPSGPPLCTWAAQPRQLPRLCRRAVATPPLHQVPLPLRVVARRHLPPRVPYPRAAVLPCVAARRHHLRCAPRRRRRQLYVSRRRRLAPTAGLGRCLQRLSQPRSDKLVCLRLGDGPSRTLRPLWWRPPRGRCRRQQRPHLVAVWRRPPLPTGPRLLWARGPLPDVLAALRARNLRLYWAQALAATPRMRRWVATAAARRPRTRAAQGAAHQRAQLCEPAAAGGHRRLGLCHRSDGPCALGTGKQEGEERGGESEGEGTP